MKKSRDSKSIKEVRFTGTLSSTRVNSPSHNMATIPQSVNSEQHSPDSLYRTHFSQMRTEELFPVLLVLNSLILKFSSRPRPSFDRSTNRNPRMHMLLVNSLRIRDRQYHSTGTFSLITGELEDSKLIS